MEGGQENGFEPPSDEITHLTSNQIWPFILSQLCKELNVVNEDGISDMGKFYATVSDWKHDQHLFILLLMFRSGFPLDTKTILGNNAKQVTTKDNAINLICGIISLLEIELGEPWESFEIQVDDSVRNFYYLANLIRDGINNYIEAIIYKAVMKQKLFSHKEYEQIHNKIKFKQGNGKYFATILKSVLQYDFPEGSGGDKSFNDISWPWLKHLSPDHFAELLKEALTLWDSVHKMVSELAEKSRLDYIQTAFDNAEYVLKSKVQELKIL